MFIKFGKFNLKKYLFLLLPLIKLIRDISKLSNAFYNVKNIIIQYIFLCLSKFGNVIFWFILIKKLQITKKFNEVKEKDNTEVDIIEIIPEENENQKNEEKNKKTNNKASKGLSQKEIYLNEQEKKKKKKFYKEIIFLMISSLIDFLSNFSYLISYAYIKTNDDSTNNNNTTTYINTNNNISFNYIYEIRNFTSDNKDKKQESLINLIPFRLCMRIILIYSISLIFFSFDRPHRHQVISLLFILIIIISEYCIEIILNIQEINTKGIYYFIYFLQEFLFCFDNIIGAKYLSISQGNVYQLLFFNGLFGILMIIIITFCSKFIHCSELHLNEDYCKDGNLKYLIDFKFLDLRLLKFILNLLLSILEMACTWLLIFYQTVNHLSVACAIHLIYRFLFGGDEKTSLHIIMGIISLILISIFAFIFNEIIILKFCNLDKNTIEVINQRAIEDQTLVERISVEHTSDSLISDD